VFYLGSQLELHYYIFDEYLRLLTHHRLPS
jgi:hypothetical protein